MTSLFVRAVVIALLVLGSSLTLQAQVQNTPKTAKLSGSIAGRITIKNKGAAGIVVTLRNSEMSTPFEMLPRSVSDQDGNYKITGVGPGSYEVTPGNIAYVVADNLNRSRLVTVTDGEAVENINFTLVRGGVITGKITDADGRPVIQQQVRLMRADNPDPRAQQPARTPIAVSQMVTDDRGVYRVFGLTAGKYKVATGRGEDPTYSFNFGGRALYKEVYYPDTTDVTKATVIEVSEGSEATNIDLALGRPIETFTASGQVVDEKGLPIPGARLGLQRLMGERPEFISNYIVSQSNGNFAIEGLIPGKYVPMVLQESNNELKTDSTTFDIIDTDLSGINIRLVKGASISGVLVLETDDKQAFAKLSKLQIVSYVQSQTGMSMPSSSRSAIGADGSFRVGGLATGTAQVNLSPTTDMNQMKGFMVSRLERDGVVQSRGIEVKDGEQITGVRLIVSYGNSTLRGVVNIENGPLPPEARLFVRLTKPGENSSSLRPPRVDERGRFNADGIPPGTYELSVMVYAPNQKPRPPVKQLVTLQDGITTDVAITLDLAANPKP